MITDNLIAFSPRFFSSLQKRGSNKAGRFYSFIHILGGMWNRLVFHWYLGHHITRCSLWNVIKHIGFFGLLYARSCPASRSFGMSGAKRSSCHSPLYSRWASWASRTALQTRVIIPFTLLNRPSSTQTLPVITKRFMNCFFLLQSLSRTHVTSEWNSSAL